MEQLLYKVEDRPPMLITTVLLSLQHLLAALGGIIAVPLVFGGALKLPADQIVALVNAALLGSGVVTIVQCRGWGPWAYGCPASWAPASPSWARASAWGWSMAWPASWAPRW